MPSANSDRFISSFPFWIPFLFLVWILWCRLPKLYWIEVVNLHILILFLISAEILSAFHHWAWHWLCIILSMHCWISFANILLIIFASMFLSDLTVVFHNVFVWFWFQGDVGLVEWFQQYSFLLSSLKSFEKDKY